MSAGLGIHAYVLAADPTWLTSSVSRYYDLVDRIVVSYDSAGRGWSGAPIDAEQSIRKMRALDRDRKAVYVPGTFSDASRSAMDNDTEQRREALAVAGEGAKWVLQLDTDEVLPRPAALFDVLDTAARDGQEGVEWPMRVLYRRRKRDYLEVVDREKLPRYEYPGPVAVRPTAGLVEARRIEGPFLRCVVEDDLRSLQLQRSPGPGETRLAGLPHDAAILHNSWARNPEVVRKKVRSWGHNRGWRSEAYYWTKWYSAPLTWRLMRDFHPFSRGLWPRLAPTSDPQWLLAEEDL